MKEVTTKMLISNDVVLLLEYRVLPPVVFLRISVFSVFKSVGCSSI